MGCKAYQNCGGCLFRNLSDEVYQAQKQAQVLEILHQNLGTSFEFETPVFLPDGLRRRASFAFCFKKGLLTFGFNQNKSHQIIDCTHCFMLNDKINNSLESIRSLIEQMCRITPRFSKKQKTSKPLESGDLEILSADNGLDIVLEAQTEFGLEYRMAVSEFMNASASAVRFSFRNKHTHLPETIVEKTKPIINIAGFDVFPAPGDFLQASKEAQDVLTGLVNHYLGDISGTVADLFCGIGTFSYALCRRSNIKVVAVDSSKALIKGFQEALHKQMIQNVSVFERNLFKDPLEPAELKKIDFLVFDPPRAGAKEQVAQISKADLSDLPAKIVAVSCNPVTFASNAKALINHGYVLQKVTMVDQFVYSAHSELVALFTNPKKCV